MAQVQQYSNRPIKFSHVIYDIHDPAVQSGKMIFPGQMHVHMEQKSGGEK